MQLCALNWSRQSFSLRFFPPFELPKSPARPCVLRHSLADFDRTLGEWCISWPCCSIFRIALVSPKGEGEGGGVKTSRHIFNWLVQRETASFVTCCCLVFVDVAVVSPRLCALFSFLFLPFSPLIYCMLSFWIYFFSSLAFVITLSPLSSPLLSSPPLSVVLFLCDLLI